LMARVRQERFPVPLPFGCDLGQQKPTVPSAFDDETVATDLELIGRAHRLERTEKGELEAEIWKLVDRDLAKPGIGAARRDRAPRDHASQRLVGFDVADASTKFTVLVNRDEDT